MSALSGSYTRHQSSNYPVFLKNRKTTIDTSALESVRCCWQIGVVYRLTHRQHFARHRNPPSIVRGAPHVSCLKIVLKTLAAKEHDKRRQSVVRRATAAASVFKKGLLVWFITKVAQQKFRKNIEYDRQWRYSKLNHRNHQKRTK